MIGVARAGLINIARALLVIAAFPLVAGAEDRQGATLVQRIDACVAEIGVHGNPAELCLGLYAQPCMEKPEGQTTIGIVQCISDETRAWDAILNREYKRLLPRLDEEQVAAIRNVQRAWIAFRDVDCAFPHVLIRGTLAQPWSADCFMQHTARRAMEIRGLVDYAEN